MIKNRISATSFGKELLPTDSIGVILAIAFTKIPLQVTPQNEILREAAISLQGFG